MGKAKKLRMLHKEERQTGRNTDGLTNRKRRERKVVKERI